MAIDREPVETDRAEQDGAAPPTAEGAVPVPSVDVGVPVIDVPLPPPAGWSDLATGVDGPRYWDRLLLSEQARVQRYKRPATVVLVEVTGLGPLAQQWGPEAAERTLVAAARTLAREIRTSDHIARIEPARFGILLTETSEIAAINFVERARAACERGLHLASDTVGIGFGWASPPKGSDLTDSVVLAQHRLDAELREA
jgi:diguanylate cyclase (GGDEF)-like protein